MWITLILISYFTHHPHFYLNCKWIPWHVNGKEKLLCWGFPGRASGRNGLAMERLSGVRSEKGKLLPTVYHHSYHTVMFKVKLFDRVSSSKLTIFNFWTPIWTVKCETIHLQSHHISQHSNFSFLLIYVNRASAHVILLDLIILIILGEEYTFWSCSFLQSAVTQPHEYNWIYLVFSVFRPASLLVSSKIYFSLWCLLSPTRFTLSV
jgi:hypothetical protein